MRLIKDENGKVRLLAMVDDDDGNFVFDLKCPIQCGKCCDEWRNLQAFGHFAKEVLGVRDCPNLGPMGCKLPRKKRPIECTVFLCELALLDVHGLLSNEERDRVLVAHRQQTAFDMLGKYPEPDIDIRADAAKFKPGDGHKIDKLFRKREKSS